MTKPKSGGVVRQAIMRALRDGKHIPSFSAVISETGAINSGNTTKVVARMIASGELTMDENGVVRAPGLPGTITNRTVALAARGKTNRRRNQGKGEQAKCLRCGAMFPATFNPEVVWHGEVIRRRQRVTWMCFPCRSGERQTDER